MPILHLGEYLFRQNPSTSAMLVENVKPEKVMRYKLSMQ